MAITWTDKDGNVVKTTHEGLVLRDRFCECVRVMSDIYSDEFYALVWNPETGRTEDVHIGSCFELFSGPWGHATVDATPDTLKAYQGLQDELRMKREAELAKENEKARLAYWNMPAKGKRMRVVRGRKVPKGTEGIVFWVRDGRVGLALDETKDAKGHYANVAWVDGIHLENVAILPAE